jgi:hypothetical protein
LLLAPLLITLVAAVVVAMQTVAVSRGLAAVEQDNGLVQELLVLTVLVVAVAVLALLTQQLRVVTALSSFDIPWVLLDLLALALLLL